MPGGQPPAEDAGFGSSHMAILPGGWTVIMEVGDSHMAIKPGSQTTAVAKGFAAAIRVLCLAVALLGILRWRLLHSYHAWCSASCHQS